MTQPTSTMPVAALLNQPAAVQIVLAESYAQRCIAGQVLTGVIDATGSGAAVIESAGLFTDFAPEVIPELADYPLASAGQDHQIIPTSKWGLSTLVSAEAVARNRFDLVKTRMSQMAATLARAVDEVAFGAVKAAPLTMLPASAPWGSANADPLRDILTAAAMIEETDSGASANVVVTTPMLWAEIVTASRVIESAPIDAANNPVLTGNLFRFGGLSILKTTRDFGADALVCDSRMFGGIVVERIGGQGWSGSTSDLTAPESRVEPLSGADGWRISQRKVCAPVISVPEAAVVIRAATA